MELAPKFGASGFKASNGRLDNFLDRHGIDSAKLHGEGGSADPANVEKAQTALPELLGELAEQGYTEDDIYNVDETGLFYRADPTRTYILRTEDRKNLRGGKRAKERITVILCTNASGTHKLKPLIINKSAVPRCFGRWSPHSYCHYRYNKKAWMNQKVGLGVGQIK